MCETCVNVLIEYISYLSGIHSLHSSNIQYQKIKITEKLIHKTP